MNNISFIIPVPVSWVDSELKLLYCPIFIHHYRAHFPSDCHRDAAAAKQTMYVQERLTYWTIERGFFFGESPCVCERERDRAKLNGKSKFRFSVRFIRVHWWVLEERTTRSVRELFDIHCMLFTAALRSMEKCKNGAIDSSGCSIHSIELSDCKLRFSLWHFAPLKLIRSICRKLWNISPPFATYRGRCSIRTIASNVNSTSKS